MKIITAIALLLITLFISCKDTKEERIIRLISEWNGKTILFPQSMNLISYIDTNEVIRFSDVKKKYTILHYVDTIGCVSCKLRLSEWGKLIRELDSISNQNVNCLISFFPMRKKELIKSLKINKFKYHVHIDEKDSLNHLNNFSKEDAFHTFLLDSNDKIIAVGSPIHNSKVKDLYLKIIRGSDNLRENKIKFIKTKINIDETSVHLGQFNWEKEQNATFVIKNIGSQLLIIEDVNTSCGCISVEYSKEPIRPGMNLNLSVIYKADHPEHFSKTVTVHCNSESSPINLTVTGNAQ